MAMLSGKKGLMAEINLTPMIDLLLVLIIIFMVVSVQTRQKGLEAQIPQAAQDGRTPEPVRTIVIQVLHGRGDTPLLRVNQEDVAWSELRDRLFDIFNQRAEKVAFVEADREVEFRHVADVIDTARGVGVTRVGLLSQKTVEMARR